MEAHRHRVHRPRPAVRGRHRPRLDWLAEMDRSTAGGPEDRGRDDRGPGADGRSIGRDDDPDLAGYTIWWRDTTAPQWTHSRFVPAGTTQFTLEGMVIDNFLFGVSSVGRDGNESVVVFPSGRLQR